MLLPFKDTRKDCLDENWYIIAIVIKLHDYMGPHWGRSKDRGVLRSWKGSIQAKSKPEENLDQLKVCWQSPKLNENHLAYEKR